jgi:hypothetical protein
MTTVVDIRIQESTNGIIHLSIPDWSRQTVDAAYGIIHRMDDDYAATKRHMRIIYDVRGAGAISSYGVRKLYKVVYETPPSLQQSCAALMDNSPASKILQIAINSLPKWIINDNTRIFYNEPDARTWLENRKGE